MKFIPYGKQYIDDDDINAVVEVLRSDFLTTGPMVKNFEEALADYLGVKHVVVLSNGTAALHAACFSAGIGPGDEVITTPITFAASANAVLYCGGTPVFADIDPLTYNIDPQSIENQITERTKAIIPVHFTGQPCDMEAILKIAKKYNLIVIEDGAHVLGAEFKGDVLGCSGNMMTLSFHPVKHITTGEGGAVVTNDEELYKKLKLFRSHGITKDYIDLNHSTEPWYYEQHELGYNYRISDIQCALGVNQLKKNPDFLKKRRAIADQYNDAFEHIEGIVLQKQIENVNSSWHIYLIQLELEKLSVGRSVIFNALRDSNLGVNVHYIPVYYHPYYRNLGYEKGICPKAENLYERIITIPLFPTMTKNEVDYVIETVKKIILKYKK